MKVLITTNIPSPYRVDFFNELGNSVDLTVLYERKYARDRDKVWLDESARNFNAVFLKGINIGDENALSRGIMKYLRDRQYDLIILGGYSTPSGILSIKYMQLLKRPFVLDCDGGIINQGESPIKYACKKSLISSASWWTSTGDLTTRYLVHYGADIDHIFVYPFTSIKKSDVLENASDESIRSHFRRELEISEDKVILSVGQFIHRKGYDILLKACKDLDKSYGIYIVGGKPTAEYIELKDKYGLSNVHFVGFKTKSELAKYYKAADLFVLPTREDIWGLVINEAMAYGLPVITTKNCVAGLEMVVDGENGYLVPVEDAEALEEKIKAVMLNDQERSRMAGNNIIKARDFTIENMTVRYVEIFKTILNQS